jgi:acetyl esterase/lipase
MKSLKIIFQIFILFMIYSGVNAQNQVIKVWPKGIPGSIPNETYTEKETLTDKVPTRYEKVIDPTLTVYLPPADKATGTAVLICPGGGYGVLAFGHEGHDIAKWLNKNGIAGIILKYRLPSDLIMQDKSTGPLSDAQEAMRIVRRNALAWKINPRRIGIIGFSAGGHLASTLSTHYSEKVYESGDTTSARPDFSLLIYPVISFDTTIYHAGSRRNLIGQKPTEELVKRFSNELQVNAKTPPAFLVHSADDRAVPPKNSIVYFEAMTRNKVPVEMHVFQSGGHGYGLSEGKGTQSAWPELCIKWLNSHGF